MAVTQRIPAGHKVATRPIPLGEPIRKFDQIIGFATTDIAPGEHIHVHNCGMREFARDYAVGQDVRPTPMVPRAERRVVRRLRARQRQGRHAQLYRHPVDGELLGLGRRKFIADAVHRPRCWRSTRTSTASSRSPTAPAAAWPSSGEGYAALQRTLWGYAAHPNFAAILMIGLGCEVMQIVRS